MFPPFWGFPPVNPAMLQQMQQYVEQMQGRFDASFRALLALDPRVVAQTPADVVFRKNKLRLLHYRAVAPQVQPVPLLVVPSILTRYYALDLMPGQSMIEYLVGRGIDVYLLDWGPTGKEDRSTTFDQYVTGRLGQVVQQVRAHAGGQPISMLGYSLGGTWAAIYSALFPEDVRNLVAIGAPINFHDNGVLSQWTRKERFNVDLVVDTIGAMPAPLMQASFRMLKPTLTIAQQLALADTSGELDVVQDYLAMQSWLTDTTPWLGEAYRTYIKECYQENHLVQGKLVVAGRRVDLRSITCALLTVTAAKDQLCPPRSSAVLHDLASSRDKQLLELPGGHVSMVSGRKAINQLWPQLADWLIRQSA